MEYLLTVILILLCLAAEGFFSGSEIGVISADRIKLRHDAAQGGRGAGLALKMLEKPEWLLSTTLVGTNIAVVTNTTLTTALMIQLFGEQGSWLAIVLIAPLIWIFGEIIPKSVFQQQADQLTPKAIFLLRLAAYLFFPLLAVFTFLTRVLTRISKAGGANPFTLREEIETMLEMPEGRTEIEFVEKTMIRRVFNFRETEAGEIMVPLIDVAIVDQTATCGEAMQIAVDKSHSRLVVSDERVDKVIGMLNTLELLGIERDKPVRPFIRPVSYIPGSKSIQDLLLELRQDGDSMAVVVDEFGGAEGLITIEDIVEEVVEEIGDEYDLDQDQEHMARKISAKDYIVNARIELDDFWEELGIELPKGNYTTLAGYLLELTRDIPKVGDIIDWENVSFTIMKATPQAIQEVRVRW